MADFDLTGYPKPAALQEISYEAILAAMKADLVTRFPAAAGFIDLESEPSHYILQVAAYREMQLRADFNDVVRSNILAYSLGTDLDHLSAFYDVVRMSGEDDERLRLRTILTIQGRSTGGTAPRYRAIALGASLRVKDAVVYKIGTNPTVHIAVYAADNAGVADAGLLALVNQAVQAPAVRMVNDTLNVRAAVFATVNVAADIWLLPETPDSALPALETALRAAWAAETGLGFDLTRAWLTARLMRPGVQKVEITAPAQDVVAEPFSAISLGTVTLTNRGRSY